MIGFLSFARPFCLLFTILAVACSGRRSTRFEPARGVILVSVDSLSAEHLSTYGYARPTSPFLDSLAARGVLFENAIVQSPRTLVSHISMLTGLYPREHHVNLPGLPPSPRVELLAERFSEFGYRTGGFTEGGFASRTFGIHRGFDVFEDSPAVGDRGVEITFDRALEFVSNLAVDDDFFLFIQTSSPAAPYEPPEDFAGFFAEEEPLDVFASTIRNLRRTNQGFQNVSPEIAVYFRDRYDEGVRYLDEQLANLFGRLETMGVLDDCTVVLTSSHGEEFMEHGKLGHEQLFLETIRVPLLVLHPGLEGGRRIPDFVQSIDIAPTLYELAGLPPPERASGQSLVGGLHGASVGGLAYSEVGGRYPQRTLLMNKDARPIQYLESRVAGEKDGTWITKSVLFRVNDNPVQFRIVSFEKPRRLEVMSEAGDVLTRVDVGTAWQESSVGLPFEAIQTTVEFRTADCSSPEAPEGKGPRPDPRCLSFKLDGIDLTRRRLFDLAADPSAMRDLGGREPDLWAEIAERLDRLTFLPVAKPRQLPLSENARAVLREHGYIE